MASVWMASRGISTMYRLQAHRLSPLALSQRQLQGVKLSRTATSRASAIVPVAALHTFHSAPFEPVSLPKFQSSPNPTSPAELLLVAACEEDFNKADDKVTTAASSFEAYDAVIQDAIADVLAAGGFEGKQGQQSKVLRLGGSAAHPKYVGLLGMGKQEELSAVGEWGQSTFQAAGSAAAGLSIAQKAASLSVAFLRPPSVQECGAFARGLLAAAFVPTRFKSEVKDPLRLEAVTLLADVAVGELEAELRSAEAVARGSLLTRYLVEAPPNVCTPTHLADAAQYLATKYPGTMKLTVYEREECAAMGMGAYLAVSECSEEPPKFIHLTYTPPGGAGKKVAICGKGVTFDTGGYNIKAGPGSMIELMKFDMGGSAATLGAANIIGALEPAGVEVHFIVAACENMIDGRGLRPGDVVTAASGKTIEVNNTDAEGRLTLADAVWFAQEKVGASTVVDVATLTGAAIVALGLDIAALISSSDELSASLTQASRTAGEKLWRLPLESNYMDSLKSSVADMRNSGGRWGGAITGALFIKEFVRKDVEWAHIDLAGPVWNEKLGWPTGYGAMTLAAWVVDQGKKQNQEQR